jgi:ADP-ribose pyrophosphatase YjhB (NUDIX family)
MAQLQATVVVIDQGKILLVFRQDLRAWALPGGRIESGESAAQAAVSRVREETGLAIELTRLVGIYARPDWPGDTHSAIFAATLAGGNESIAESKTRRYFLPDALPDRLLWWHWQPIEDALAGTGGSVVWSQKLTWPFGDKVSPAQFMAWLGQGALPTDFLPAVWDAWCGKPLPGEQTCEVGES